MTPEPQRPPTFTIGNTESYLQGLTQSLSEDVALLKTGMHDNYPGGIVFQTPMDARRFINENLSKETIVFSVFELDADWEHDCYERGYLFDKCYWRYLIKARPIVCLVEDA